MTRSLSLDLRKRIATALAEGATTPTVAKRFGGLVATAVRIGPKHRSGRGLALGKIGGHQPFLLTAEAEEWLRARLMEKGDMTTRALVAELAAGDVVILDNLGNHKNITARNAIRQAGAHMLFLPSYSPDQPHEMMFAKLKTLTRKADERTVEATWKRVGVFLEAFPPSECAAY